MILLEQGDGVGGAHAALQDVCDLAHGRLAISLLQELFGRFHLAGAHQDHCKQGLRFFLQIPEGILQTDLEKRTVIEACDPAPGCFPKGREIHPFAGAAQALHQVGELVRAHGFQHDEVGFHGEALGNLGKGRDDNHRYIFKAVVRLHFLKDLCPRGTRQGEVEQDNIGLAQGEPLEGEGAIRGNIRPVPGQVHHMPEEGGNIAVVFDDEHKWLFHLAFPF